MTELLLIAGTALCALSVLMAIVSVARTEAPRAAAAALVLGILLLFLGAWLAPEPFRVQQVGEAWSALLTGRIRL